MSGTVLCGVGDSDTDGNVVRASMEISERLGLRLVLAKVVHVGDRQALAADSEAYWREQRGASMMLEQVARDHGLSAKVERRVVVGDTAESLARIATDEAAAMIVIGDTRGGLFRNRARQLSSNLQAATRIPVVLAPRAAPMAGTAKRRAEVGA